MRRALGLVGCLLLEACSGGAHQTGLDIMQDTGAAVIRQVSASDLQKLKDTCMAAAPAVLGVMNDPRAPSSVKSAASYPYSFCVQLITNSPNNADQGSLTWLPKVLTDIQIAAQIAGYVLPVVLSVL